MLRRSIVALLSFMHSTMPCLKLDLFSAQPAFSESSIDLIGEWRPIRKDIRGHVRRRRHCHNLAGRIRLGLRSPICVSRKRAIAPCVSSRRLPYPCLRRWMTSGSRTRATPSSCSAAWAFLELRANHETHWSRRANQGGSSQSQNQSGQSGNSQAPQHANSRLAERWRAMTSGTIVCTSVATRRLRRRRLKPIWERRSARPWPIRNLTPPKILQGATIRAADFREHGLALRGAIEGGLGTVPEWLHWSTEAS